MDPVDDPSTTPAWGGKGSGSSLAKGDAASPGSAGKDRLGSFDDSGMSLEKGGGAGSGRMSQNADCSSITSSGDNSRGLSNAWTLTGGSSRVLDRSIMRRTTSAKAAKLLDQKTTQYRMFRRKYNGVQFIPMALTSAVLLIVHIVVGILKTTGALGIFNHTAGEKLAITGFTFGGIVPFLLFIALLPVMPSGLGAKDGGPVVYTLVLICLVVPIASIVLIQAYMNDPQ